MTAETVTQALREILVRGEIDIDELFPARRRRK
jgi:hypothetical protein